MTTLTEVSHAGEFLVSEAPGSLSRETVTVLSGQNLKAGEVIAKVSRGVGRASVPTVVGTGNGTMSLVTAGSDVQVGNYVVKCTAVAANGGTFSVTAPDGAALPALTLTAGAGTATAYASSHINFTITDGATDFAVNDVFTIVVGTTAPLVVGTGNGTISAITMGAEAKTGNYLLTLTAAVLNGGTFSVRDPEGNLLPDLVLTAGAGTATAYTSPQINFTVTDGATDFAANDVFNVAVFNQVTKKVKAWTPSGVDGSEDPVGILFDAVDASTADKAGVGIVRNAEVNESELNWSAAITAAQKAVALARLKAFGIVAR